MNDIMKTANPETAAIRPPAELRFGLDELISAVRMELAKAKESEAEAKPTTGLSLTAVELELRVATEMQADGSVKLAILSVGGKQSHEVSHVVRLRFGMAPEPMTPRDALLDLSPIPPKASRSRSRSRRGPR